MVRQMLLVAIVLTLLTALGLGAAGVQDSMEAAAPATVTVVMGDRGTGSIDPMAVAYKEITKQTGITVNFELVPRSDYKQKKRTLIATDDVPDLLQIAQADILDFADAGVFMPLNDVIDDQVPSFSKLLQLEENQDVWKASVDGVLYAFPILKRYEFHRGLISVIRVDALKSNGLSMPSDFDELYSALKVFQKADPEAHVWTSRGGSKNLMGTMAYTWGTGNDVYYDKDLGRYAYGPVSPRYKDLLAYLRRAYQDRILDPDYVSITTQQWREKLGSGKSLFFYDNPTYGKRSNDAIVNVIPDGWFEPTPVLENPYGGRRSLFYQRNLYGSQWAIGAKSENKDAALRLMNFLYSDEGATLKTFGLEGEHYERMGDDYKFTDAFLANYKNERGGYKIDGIMKDLGVGLYSDFVALGDMRIYRLSWPEYQINWYEKMEQEGTWSDPVVDPPFNADERAKIGDLKTKLDTILTEALDKVILGDMPLDAYDGVIERLKTEGGMELEKIYNDAQARFEKM